MAFSAYVLALVATLILAGHWSDHIGRRAALVLAVLVGLAGGFVFATADGLLELCAGRALQGAAVALATGASSAALRELLPSRPEWASRFTLLASAGGVAAGPAIGGMLSVLPGPTSTPYYLHSVVLLALLVPLYLLKARPRPHLGRGSAALEGPRTPAPLRVQRGTWGVLARLGRGVPQLRRLRLLPLTGSGLLRPDCPRGLPSADRAARRADPGSLGAEPVAGRARPLCGAGPGCRCWLCPCC